MSLIFIDNKQGTKFSEFLQGTITFDFDLFKFSSARPKISVTDRLHFSSFDSNFLDYLKKLSTISDKVFVEDGEYDLSRHQTIPKYQNVYWLLPGMPRQNYHNLIFWGDWFNSTVQLYKKLPSKLSSIEYQTKKPKYFDALLGTARPHRKYLYKKILELGLQDQLIMSFQENNNFLYEEDTVVTSENRGVSTDLASYYGNEVNVSQIIPISIYNQTAYSMVSETCIDYRFNFFTEKIVKPILSRRLFIVFAGYNYLADLKKLGFKTFNNVIDESYDTVLNYQDRFNLALEQVKFLCSLDQIEIYEKIKDTVEHNFNLMYSTDWIKFAGQKFPK